MLSISLQETPDAEQDAAEQPLPAFVVSMSLIVILLLLLLRQPPLVAVSAL